MTISEFFRSHAGKSVIGLTLMALVLVVPPSINFLAAGFFLAWTIHHLQAAFRQLDAAEAAARTQPASRDLVHLDGRALVAGRNGSRQTALASRRWRGRGGVRRD